MKRITLFFLLTFYTLVYSQFKQILSVDRDLILSPGNPSKKNPFEGRFLLVGLFLPVKESSDIKLAKVLTTTGWGLIDEKGQIVLPTQYFSISEFKNGLAIASRHTSNPQTPKCYSMINGQGKIITPQCFNKIEGYSTGDIDGFTQLRIKNTSKLADGLTKVRINKLTSIYNENGEQIIPAEYSEITFSGKYFIAQKETPKKTYDIYDINAKKIKTIDAVSVDITSDMAIIRNNRKEHVEDLITGKKYFENKFHTMSAINSERDDLNREINLVGSCYADTINYSGIETISYINKDFEIIRNKTYSKSPQRYMEDVIRAENPENNDIAILNSKGEVLHQYTREEYLNYTSLDSEGYKKEENLQENLFKYHHLWSKFTYLQRAIDCGDLFIIKIYDHKDQKNSKNVFIQKKDGKILYRIKGEIDYYDIHPNKKLLIGYIRNPTSNTTFGVITDTNGAIIKKAKAGQVYKIFMGKLLVSDNHTYHTDKNYNPIYRNKIISFEKIKDSPNYVGISPQKTEIYNAKGKVIQTINGFMHQLYPHIPNRIPQDCLTIITEKSYSVFNKNTWEPILQFNFKSQFFGQLEDGMYVHEEYEDEALTRTYIDPYLNIIKITY